MNPTETNRKNTKMIRFPQPHDGKFDHILFIIMIVAILLYILTLTAGCLVEVNVDLSKRADLTPAAKSGTMEPVKELTIKQ